jgi:aryl-alcohol dehydrogenase-like predicted oxidoreductase
MLDKFSSTKFPFVNESLKKKNTLIKLNDFTKELSHKKKLKYNLKFNRIILGGAQFGFKYGEVSSSNFTSKKTLSFLNFANELGVNIVDTSPGYKLSEKRIGNYLKKKKNKLTVITKLQKLNEKLPKNKLYDKIKKSILVSKKKLYKNNLIVLTHEIYKSNNFFKKVLSVLSELKKENFIIDYGSSVYYLNQMKIIFQFSDLKYVEIPVNILDNRFLQKPLLKIYSKKKIKLLGRSIFIQGSLIHGYPKKISNRFKKKISKQDKKFDFLVKKFKRIDKIDLFLGYVISLNHINKIIIGMNDIDELILNLFYFTQKKFKKKDLNYMQSFFEKTPKELTNPIYWYD